MSRTTIELDRIDRLLLHWLQLEARLSNTELAQRVGLSQSACSRRVQRLEHAQVIVGYSARLNAAALGKGNTVFVEVTLANQGEAALDAFERAAAGCPDILECHLIAGDYDYLLRVIVADTADYERLHRKQLASIPHIARIRSHFAIRAVSSRVAIES